MALYSPELDPASDATLWERFDRADWAEMDWWKRQAFDLAIFYGIGSFPAEALRASRRSGATVVVEADTDGWVSPRQAPFRQLVRRWDGRLPAGVRWRSLKAGFDDWIRRGARTESDVLAFLSEADFIKVESAGPTKILRSFLISKGKPTVAERIVTIPFAVRDEFARGPLPGTKEQTVLLAGRLSEIQKGPQETAAVVRQLMQREDSVGIEIHLRGESSPEFEELARCSSKVRLFFNTGRAELAERLRSVAVLFSRSRWETTPVIALEALCCGCTLVAPQELPGYQSLIQEGRFGQTYERNSDRKAVQAILTELNRWCTGERESAGIAEYWRKRASLASVVEQLLELRGRDSRIQATEQSNAFRGAAPVHSEPYP